MYYFPNFKVWLLTEIRVSTSFEIYLNIILLSVPILFWLILVDNGSQQQFQVRVSYIPLEPYSINEANLNTILSLTHTCTHIHMGTRETWNSSASAAGLESPCLGSSFPLQPLKTKMLRAEWHRQVHTPPLHVNLLHAASFILWIPRSPEDVCYSNSEIKTENGVGTARM